MAVEITNLNGLSPYIDYATLQKTAERMFSDDAFEVKIVIFNNFPLAISSQTAIDLVFFINAKNKRDRSKSYEFYGKKFKNLIIPIKIANSESFEGVHGYNLDFELVEEIFTTDIFLMNEKLVNYLTKKCGFDEVRVEPLVYIKFPDFAFGKSLLFAPTLEFNSISRYLQQVRYQEFSSYSQWSFNTFDTFLYDVKRVVDRASKDAEYGYLTKKKLDYIARKRKLSDNIFDELGTKTVIIEGKAGTGKTMELMNMASRKIESGGNVLYLTYNTLLVNDVAKTLKHRQNALLNANQKLVEKGQAELQVKVGELSVSTIHYYIYHLVKSLGITLIINAERIQELISNLQTRTAEVVRFLNNNINPAENFNPNFLRTLIQNNPQFSKELKEAGILLINFLEKKRYDARYPLAKNVDFFVQDRTKFLLKNFQNEVFISDYHNVLNETLKALRNTNDFYDEYKVETKGELLKNHFNLDNEDVASFSRITFSKKISKRVISRLRKRTVFVDEAHDCTKIERDILMAVFKPHNFAVTSGGKEQLIRTGELLPWSVSSGFNHPSKTFKKENRTFRMKSNVVHLVNFIAKKFNIDINLTPDSTDDTGTLTFDFRPTSEENMKSIVSEFYNKGFLNGYSPYESLLFLIDSRTDHKGNKEKEEDKLVITEDNNIAESKGYRRQWQFTEALNKNDGFFLWNGTGSDKNNLPLPQSLDARLIYYESCRGLEAHTVLCFALDQYFHHKSKDDEASLYLLNDMFKTDEERKNAYAITAVLMALTRAIDSLYINIKEEHTLLGKILLEYAALFPEKVKLLKS